MPKKKRANKQIRNEYIRNYDKEEKGIYKRTHVGSPKANLNWVIPFSTTGKRPTHQPKK
jgi:hypothetical protein